MAPLILVLLALAGAPTHGAAQTSDEPGFVIGAGQAGIGIGDVPRLKGLRLNFRDRELERVSGLNLTIWGPHGDLAAGRVEGLAAGLPMTGARTLSGIGVGAGIAVFEDFRGIGLAVLGMGAGRDLEGLFLGGLGFGAGRSLRGIAAGGLGMGVGGDASGILLGGLGMGVQGDLRGIAIGGLGGGVGGSMKGIFLGGVGGGIGGSAHGIVFGGVGAGVGDDLVGIGIGGLGLGVGGELRGLSVTGLGVGAERIRGLVLSGFGAGALRMSGAVIAPAFMQVGSGEDWGELRGVSVSAFNWIRGSQRGITIGLLNITEELHGLQVGLINIARNKESFSVLPILNWSR
ncbi:MAG: hypothetical protein PVJ80_11280 [Gemmatimonadota bacterium]|jgi:hypothetical protein